MKEVAIDAARFSGDVELLREVRADPVLRDRLEDSAARRRRNALRSRLLSHAVRIDVKLLPHLAEPFARLGGQFDLAGGLDQQRAHYQMLFLLPDDRKQMVYVRDASVKGRKVVTFFSPCLVVKKGLVSGLKKETAMELLKANQRLQFARYGIWESEQETTVLASFDCLLDTLDPAECHNAAWSVAFAADRFERLHGQDRL